jgi:hypothetical protein
VAALKSIQGSTIFTTATKSKKMMSDLNFNPIPSEIKYFIPGKETVNDISNLFGSLQKMKIPQVESDIDLEVVNSYTTDLSGINNIITVIILLSLVTWIPQGNKDDTEKNGFISPDFVKSFISELLNTDRSMLINMTVTNTDCLLYHGESQQIITKT